MKSCKQQIEIYSFYYIHFQITETFIASVANHTNIKIAIYSKHYLCRSSTNLLNQLISSFFCVSSSKFMADCSSIHFISFSPRQPSSIASYHTNTFHPGIIQYIHYTSRSRGRGKKVPGTSRLTFHFKLNKFSSKNWHERLCS